MFCPKCGKETDSDAKFCRHCGEPLTPSPDPGDDVPMPGGNDDHPRCRCPKCRSTNIQTIVLTDSQTTGKNYSAGKGCCGWIMFGPLGLLCGSCGQGQQTTTTSKTMLACNDCGNQFYSRKEYAEKYEQAKKGRKYGLIGNILLSIGFAMMGIGYLAGVFGNWKDALISYIPYILFCAGVDVGVYFMLKRSFKKAKAELEEFDNAQFDPDEYENEE